MIYTQKKYEEKTKTRCVSKANFYVQKMKIHVPAVNLKFFITTSNLTSNFETHNNVGDNFFFVYK